MADSPAGPGGPTYGFGLIINHFTDKDILGLNTIRSIWSSARFNLASSEVSEVTLHFSGNWLHSGQFRGIRILTGGIAGINSREVGVGDLVLGQITRKFDEQARIKT